ncbi:MAG: zf-HC2 domain-containing protein [Armatimonadota bacterium]|nr:zf-HC2 domain-containing protein [Armatimonadota bacterium]MDR7439597.1 zf-HC2 domain-containing protein [Armatimonadota bacterium]MDR7568423.1 zf-HC2 domain-containing protein [Armatimonadota bacterium]
MTTGHERLRQLLPWYAAETLGEEEAAEVREHLLHCPRCARELQSLVRLRTALRELSSSLPAPPLEVRDHTWTRILRHEREEKPRGFARFTGPLVALAAAMALVVSGIALRSDPFVTLGIAHREPSPVLQVVFHPQTPEVEIRRLLHEIGGTIEEGPRASGLYRIRLRRDANAEQALGQLRRSRAVLFAEREP